MLDGGVAGLFKRRSTVQRGSRKRPNPATPPRTPATWRTPRIIRAWMILGKPYAVRYLCQSAYRGQGRLELGHQRWQGARPCRPDPLGGRNRRPCTARQASGAGFVWRDCRGAATPRLEHPSQSGSRAPSRSGGGANGAGASLRNGVSGAWSQNRPSAADPRRLGRPHPLSQCPLNPHHAAEAECRPHHQRKRHRRHQRNPLW